MRSLLNVVNIALIVVLIAAAISVQARVDASGTLQPFSALVQ
ncbi:hypothetical protein [Maliponia aquimaris]|uniref:Uncharacterized protein n=1 Tax=Maliponia aquimaris TaxID=1673631 RepID=A0A238JQP8_9RHOB|nr:hypothetical protein [Maliponia aquimaris]SMX32980.1 hypothetical protein MAA8898_00370 [Maliponia aquimaris]